LCFVFRLFKEIFVVFAITVAIIEVIVQLFLINFFLVIKGFFLVFFLGLFFGVMSPGGIRIGPIQVKVSNDPGRGINAEFFPGVPDVLGTVRLSKEIFFKDVPNSSGTADRAFPSNIRDVPSRVKDAEDATFVLGGIASLDDSARRNRSFRLDVQAKGRDRRTRGFLATAPFAFVTRELRFAGGSRGNSRHLFRRECKG
jgi:hypothetical protein